MARLYMVRHGRAAAGFDVADPGLDELGRSQAEDVAKKLVPRGPARILTSPLQRARATALPLARLWRREAFVETAVAEIPTPPQFSVTERVPWLRKFMSGTWREADATLAGWREQVVATLTGMTEDTVIFSHFIAINVGVGHAVRDDRVVIFSPDNCSITIFDTDGRNLQLVERGHEAATSVN
jgi:broad specificity phosphatase PhoE